jgi:hypothetical protein
MFKARSRCRLLCPTSPTDRLVVKLGWAHPVCREATTPGNAGVNATALAALPESEPFSKNAKAGEKLEKVRNSLSVTVVLPARELLRRQSVSFNTLPGRK